MGGHIKKTYFIRSLVFRTSAKLLFICSYLYQRFVKEGCTYRAAALAYTTLLSLVPLMIISFSILSLIPHFVEMGHKIQQFILANFVAASANVIAQHLTIFMQNVRHLSITTLAFLAGTALLLMYNINRAFNAIWHTEPHFHFTISFLLYSLVLLASPILIGAVMLLGTVLVRLPWIASIIQMPYVAEPLFFLLPYVLIFLVFTTLNWLLPACTVRVWHALLGGGITTVLFELARYGFTVYLTHFPTYRLVYGALATVPVFLVWLYVSWTIILLGVVVTKVVAEGIPEFCSKDE